MASVRNDTGGYGSSVVYHSQTSARNDKFKTQPCKYYHSIQGCVKGNGCTYIHDEQYAGRPTPSMLQPGS